MLFLLTTIINVVIDNNVTATLLEKARTATSETAFDEVILWPLPEPVLGSAHPFRYQLAQVVGGECVLRYDNERGKGDHRHIDGSGRTDRICLARRAL